MNPTDGRGYSGLGFRAALVQESSGGLKCAVSLYR
jgi:hypothetical protein